MGSLDISSINKCFVSLGLEAVDDPSDLSSRLNDLTLYHMNWVQDKNILEERCAKLQADGSNYLNMADRVKGELDNCKREITAVGEKERQMRVKNKNLASRLKAEEEEVKKLHLVMEHKQDHFNHEMRKRERESSALKDRLNKKIMEKKTEKRNTQQVLNTMPRTGGVKRAKWGNDEREELYKQFMGDQEEKNKELVSENDHLRHCLAGLETELINFLNEGDKDESFLEGADLNPKIQSYINMPYPVVKDTFKDSIDDKILLIREKHRRLLNNKDVEEELSQLKKTIELQQLTITEQSVAIEDCSCKEGRQNYSDLHDAELDLRFQSLITQQEVLEKERANFAQEKKELDILAKKIKEDHKRFRAERTLMMESDLLKTPSLNSIKRENQKRDAITVTDKMKLKPSLREGHLFFSPAPTETSPVMNTDEFKRELSRTSNIQGLHGRILNENTATPVSKKILNVDTPEPEKTPHDSVDMQKIKTQLFNQYMNTPV